MKITVDTNVLISATFWEGDSDKIIQKVEKKEVELVLSVSIIEEFVKVLDYSEIQDKIRDKNLEMKRTVEKIMSLATIVEPIKSFNFIAEDSDDNKILECAITGKVDFIVSSDKHLLNLKEFRGIRVITPQEFMFYLRNKLI